MSENAGLRPVTGSETGPWGLGCQRLSVPALHSTEAIRVVHLALDLGVRLVDTADVYAPSAGETGHNERLLREALASWSGDASDVVVATKVGLSRSGKKWRPDGRAKHLEQACRASLEALGVERLALLQLHAFDPTVSRSTTLRALARLKQGGRVEKLGLCNVRLEDLHAAEEHFPVAAVQVALSPFDTTPVKNGVARYCRQHGIPLLAHSPLGGVARRKKMQTHPLFEQIGKRHGATPQEVALAWLLRAFDFVVPLVGATQLESVESSQRATALVLAEEEIEQIEQELPSRRALAVPVAEPPASAKGDEVVLLMGYPGAGKSTLAQSWVERGYVCLNRDTNSGRLADLLPKLDQLLGSGSRRVVMDNTYPTRDARFDVIETAWRHRVPVRCVHLDTSLEQAQVNAVSRMVRRHGRLLSPEELGSRRAAVNDFGPEAQYRYRRLFEAPTEDEGFAAIERVEFRPQPADSVSSERRLQRGLFFDYEGVLLEGCRHGFDHPQLEILEQGRAALERCQKDGYRLLAVSYLHGFSSGRLSEGELVASLGRLHSQLGLEIELHLCPHPPGPTRCWCRKPLPGLGVWLMQSLELDRENSFFVGTTSADRGFAERLGIGWLDAEPFHRGKRPPATGY